MRGNCESNQILMALALQYYCFFIFISLLLKYSLKVNKSKLLYTYIRIPFYKNREPQNSQQIKNVTRIMPRFKLYVIDRIKHKIDAASVICVVKFKTRLRIF